MVFFYCNVYRHLYFQNRNPKEPDVVLIQIHRRVLHVCYGLEW